MHSVAQLDWWVGRDVDAGEVGTWRRLLRDFGAFLPFLIDEKFVNRIPEVGSLRKFKLETLKEPCRAFKTYSGAAWVLMAHFEEYAGRLPEPFFKQGFLLPLEWRRREEGQVGRHSEWLPALLLEEADKVKRQFADNGLDAGEYYLHPWRGFRDTVDFSGMRAKTFASAWGALATGLFSVVIVSAKRETVGSWRTKLLGFFRRRTSSDGMLANWPFSSIAFDYERNVPEAVSELEQKIAIVARYGGSEIAVAPNNRAELKDPLRRLHAKFGAKVKCYDWKWKSGDFAGSLRSLTRCNQLTARCRFVRRLLLAGVGGVILMSLAAASLWYANRDVVRYFAEYEGEFREPVGIDEMSKEQALSSSQHYEFVYSRQGGLFNLQTPRRLRSVVCRDFFGDMRRPLFSDITKRPAKREFVFANGKLDAIKVSNEYDQWMYTLHPHDERLVGVFAPVVPAFPVLSKQRYLMSVKAGGKLKTLDVSSPDPTVDLCPSLSSRGKSFTLCITDTDAIGRPGRVVYLAYGGASEPIIGDEGECGISYEYDCRGRPSHVRYLNAPHARPRQRSDDVAGYDMAYGETNSLTFVAGDGRAMRGHGQFASLWYRFSEGKIVTGGYFNECGMLTTGPDRCAYWKNSFTRDRKLYKSEFFDWKGQRTVCKGGYFAVEESGQSDVRTTRWYGIDDRPCLNADGVARAERSRSGAFWNTRFFGVKDEPVCDKTEWAHAVVIDDARRTRRSMTTTLYGIDMRPVLGRNGWSRLSWVYDATGNLSKVMLYGTDLRTPVRYQGVCSGVAISYLYDLGRLSEQACSFLDEDGTSRVVDPRCGYDTLHTVFGKGGELVERYSSRNGEIVTDLRKGIASTLFDYDKQGQMTGMRFRSCDRQTLLDVANLGIAAAEIKYADGKVSEITTYGTNYVSGGVNRPKSSLAGYAKMRIAGYTSDGRPSRALFLDECDRPSQDVAFRLAEQTLDVSYDNDGRHDELINYDASHKGVYLPVPCQKKTFDAQGRLMSVEMFAEDGRTRVFDKDLLAHKLTYEYDFRGNVVKEDHYDVNLDPVKTMGMRGFRCLRDYDARGRLFRMQWFDGGLKRLACHEFNSCGCTRVNGSPEWVRFVAGVFKERRIIVALNGTSLLSGMPGCTIPELMSRLYSAGGNRILWAQELNMPTASGEATYRFYEEDEADTAKIVGYGESGGVLPSRFVHWLEQKLQAWLDANGKRLYVPQ